MTETTLQPIRKTRLFSQIADVLRQMILSGHFKPGDHLLQDKIAAELGVSRTPLREALLKLQEEGLLKLSGTRGVEVAKLDPTELLELYEVRDALDALAAKLAAMNATPVEKDKIKSILDEIAALVEDPDVHEWLLLNLRFHDAIVEASHNRVLRQMSTYIHTSSRMIFPVLMNTPERLAVYFQEHLRIYEAVVAGYPEEAELAAKAHVASNKEVVRRLIRNEA